MATSAVTTAASTWVGAHNLEDNFGISLHNVSVGRRRVWENPQMNSAIVPYIPKEDDKVLLASCETVFQKLNIFVDVSAEALITSNDVSMIIFPQLDPKSLSRCSKVCKSFYLITKKQNLWDNLFESCFKNVKPLSPEVCIYYSPQQFQIIYKKINDTKKPYFAKFDYLQAKCLAFYKQIIPLVFQYNDAGGKDAADDTISKIDSIRGALPWNGENLDVNEVQKFLTQLHSSDGFKAYLLRLKIIDMQISLENNVGDSYAGTVESIDPNSHLGRILTATELLIPDAFDNQEKFEEVIRQSEALKNTTSNNDGPVVEDVTDVANAQTE